jgi:hypothetical protein
MTQDDGIDSTDPRVTLVGACAFCDCKDCLAVREAGKAVIQTWEKTGYSPGLMTPALEKLKEALGK